ncbi:MAG TPA: TIGR02530 family flagellar biosynthesis protein [Bacillota bacterium]|nr:TIGR02530 family flagellar biosynthesis protein [Bacillota bacterium]
MSDRVFFPQPMIPVQQPGSVTPKAPVQKNGEFQKILEEQVGKTQLKFSSHALQRLSSRNISLTAQDLAKLSSAVQKAADKGSKESLILMRDMAFVVSIKNRTVITAVDGQNTKDNVFTNIDSAVIV